MVKMKSVPSFVRHLQSALVEALGKNRIDAQVRTEPVPTTGLFRVAVLAPKFKELKHSERQSLVWRIAESALSSDELFRISMILTLTPDEAGSGDAGRRGTRRVRATPR
jgi:hypothetical protein